MEDLPPVLLSCVLEQVVLEEEIGRGAHGRIVAATWEGTPVAVKEIHSLFSEVASDFEFDTLRKSFLKECERSSQLRHPNIVRFLGICLTRETPIPRLVMERLQCDLNNLLLRHYGIPEGIKYSILHGVSLGIRFLHTRVPSPIIHRDISSKNVLISSSMEGKIADLGTARFVDDRRQSQMTRAPGTADFMPPEVLTDSPRYSVSVDVFSFGCVMIHTLSQRWPTPSQAVVPDKETRELKAISEIQRRHSYVMGFRHLPNTVENLITKCLSNYPEDRPSIQEVTEQLAEVKAPFKQSLPSTILDAHMTLQHIKDKFENVCGEMEAIRTHLYPSPHVAKSPHKVTQLIPTQVNNPSRQEPRRLSSISEHAPLDQLNSMPAATNTSTHFTDPKAGPTSLPMPTTTSPTRTQAEGKRQIQSLVLPKLEAQVDKRPVPVLDEEPLHHPPPKPQDTADGDRHAQVCSDGDQEEVQVDSPQPVRATIASVVTTSISDIVKRDGTTVDGQATPSVLATPSTTLLPSTLAPSIASTVSASTTPAVPATANTSTPAAVSTSTMTISATVTEAAAEANPFGSKSIEMMMTNNETMCHLKDKYPMILDSLPIQRETTLHSLQQDLSDDQIANVLSDNDAHVSNQKILNCLIEQVTCEEGILDLCTKLEKIKQAPQRLNRIIEQLRRDTMNSLQAKSSTGKQRIGSDQSQSQKGGMNYPEMKLKGCLNDFKIKWDQVNDLNEKCMSSSVAELDGNVYAALESTSARFLNVRMYNSEVNEWTSLPPLQYGGVSLVTIPHKKQLLAIGGIYHPDSNTSDISKKAYLWDNKYETWLTVYPDMSTPRCYCCCVGYKSMVIVAGGIAQYEGNRTTDIVEVLFAHETNPRESNWSTVRSMPTLFCQYMVPVVVNDTLYIGAGFRKGLGYSNFSIVSASIPALLESTTRNKNPVWSRLPELPYMSFSIAECNGYLVAFGGEQLDVTGPLRMDGLRKISPVSAISVYKPSFRVWEEVGHIPHFYSLGYAVHLQENKIMFVGGFADPSCVTDDDLMTTCSVVTFTR